VNPDMRSVETLWDDFFVISCCILLVRFGAPNEIYR
jgi:hypothetical protein